MNSSKFNKINKDTKRHKKYTQTQQKQTENLQTKVKTEAETKKMNKDRKEHESIELRVFNFFFQRIQIIAFLTKTNYISNGLQKLDSLIISCSPLALIKSM